MCEQRAEHACRGGGQGGRQLCSRCEVQHQQPTCVVGEYHEACVQSESGQRRQRQQRRPHGDQKDMCACGRGRAGAGGGLRTPAAVVNSKAGDGSRHQLANRRQLASKVNVARTRHEAEVVLDRAAYAGPAVAPQQGRKALLREVAGEGAHKAGAEGQATVQRLAGCQPRRRSLPTCEVRRRPAPPRHVQTRCSPRRSGWQGLCPARGGSR